MKDHQLMKRGAIGIGAIAILIILSAVAYWFVAEKGSQPLSHSEYMLQSAAILVEYTETMEKIGTIPKSDHFVFLTSAERVVDGPSAIQEYIAIGAYDLANARLKSMRQDLEDLQSYAAKQ